MNQGAERRGRKSIGRMAIEQRVLVDALSARRHLTGGEHKLLQYMADCADKAGGSIYPSHDSMCEATRLRKRSVRRLLRRFEAHGWVQCVREGRGAGVFSIYKLTLSPLLRDRTQPVEIRSPFPVEIVTPFGSKKGTGRSRKTEKGDQPIHLSLVTNVPSDDHDTTSGITFRSDPSNGDPSNVPRTTGADAPALSRVIDDDDKTTTTTAAESETGNSVPEPLRDRAPCADPPAGDRQHRPEGDGQGVGVGGWLPATGLVDGLPGRGRDRTCVPDAAPGTTDRDAAVAPAGRATRSDAPAAAVDDGPGRSADDDARRRATFAHIDIRDYLRQLKARLNIGVTKATTTKARKP